MITPSGRVYRRSEGEAASRKTGDGERYSEDGSVILQGDKPTAKGDSLPSPCEYSKELLPMELATEFAAEG
jgi:hypothetical protein